MTQQQSPVPVVMVFSGNDPSGGAGVQADIEALMLSDELESRRSPAQNIGYSRRIENARGRYIVFCKASLPRELTLEARGDREPAIRRGALEEQPAEYDGEQVPEQVVGT